MNRRDLLKTFAAIMVALGFGKAKVEPKNGYIIFGKWESNTKVSSISGYKIMDNGDLQIFSVTTDHPTTYGNGWASLEEYKPPAE